MTGEDVRHELAALPAAPRPPIERMDTSKDPILEGLRPLALELLADVDDLEMGWVFGVASRVAVGHGGPLLPNELQLTRREMCRSILQLLERGLMEVETVTAAGSERWALSPSEAVARIEREWDELGRPPGFMTGEIGWLVFTGQGKATHHRMMAWQGPWKRPA